MTYREATDWLKACAFSLAGMAGCLIVAAAIGAAFGLVTGTAVWAFGLIAGGSA